MENKKGISGSTLKMIAIVTMVIDHIGAAVLARLLMVNGLGELDQTNADAIMQWLSANGALYWTYTIMRMIGRVAFPIFCFLLVEGFLHTHDVKKYAPPTSYNRNSYDIRPLPGHIIGTRTKRSGSYSNTLCRIIACEP